MQRRAVERRSRRRARRTETPRRVTQERYPIGDRNDASARRRSVMGTMATLIGGTLLKGLIVPLLSRLANRIPFGCMVRVVRTLCVRMFDRNEMPR
jgi:hypothetical protein